MSVVVIGMEKPKRCLACDFQCFFSDGRIYCKRLMRPIRSVHTPPPDWCPLRPFPDVHGRLIDADALHLLLERRWHDLQILDWDENPHAEDIQTGVNWCLNTLHDDAPTIIEAEGGSTGNEKENP